MFQNYPQPKLNLSSDILPFLFIPSYVEKKLLGDTDPTKEQLYLHTHCRLPNGKSPVVAQILASKQANSQTSADGDINGLLNPSTEETTLQLDPFDVNSFNFTNEGAKRVYVSTFQITIVCI